MNFLNPFWKSSFYKQEKEKYSFWKAFFRLVVVSLLIGVVYSSLFYFKFGRTLPDLIYSVETKISEGYPEDLVLSIKDKKLSKNIPGEVKLYPVSLFGKDIQNTFGDKIQYVIVIDDTKQASISSFDESKALIFFAKDGFLAKDNNKVEINTYDGFDQISKNSTFSKSILTGFFSTINEYVPGLPFGITAFIIVMYTLFAPLGNLFYLLFVGLLVMLLSPQILKRKVEYGEAYILSLYALPSIIIIESVLLYIPYVSTLVSFIPFFTTISLIMFLWYMSKENHNIKKEESASSI